MHLFAFLVIAGTLMSSALSQNVETRIHKLVTPKEDLKSGFGTTLETDQETKLLFAGAPMLPNGGFFKCNFSFESMTNGTELCSSPVTYDNENSSVGMSMTKIRVKNTNYLLVCGDQFSFSCPDQEIEQRMIGECHSYSLKSRANTPVLTPCPFECPRMLFLADLVFVLDASGSVNNDEFEESLNWVVTVLEQFKYDIDAKNLEVGYVVYGSSVEKSVSPKQRTFNNLKADVLGIRNYGGGTATHEAIKEARELLISTSRTVPKIMITVTDGASNNRQLTKDAASNARNAGIVMIAVGVGSGVREIELQYIANGNARDNTRVMTVTDFTNLNTIVGNLSNVIKETASGSLEGASSNSSTELTNCQFGTSITATSTGFFVGAVGSYDRIGTVAEYQNLRSFPNSVSTGHLDDKKIAAMLGTTTIQIKDAYFGYSITTGKFIKNKKRWIVASAPRYNSRGLVLTYQDAKSHVALRPSDDSGLWQLGGYYGHCVLAMDINKDGYDDLIVSAPLYSSLDKYDSGIVFVYMNDNSSSAVTNWANSSFSPLILRGSGLSGSRFGMAIANGGDIDNNGYEDIIIGAPYEKESTSDRGSGAIYIYFATSRGVDPATKQRIFGSSVSTNTQALTSFGYATRGGVDIDANNYPDVIVAAPSSDAVVLLRSRKIIELKLKVSLTPSVIDVINCANNLRNACSVVEVCYSAKYNDNTSPRMIFDMSLNITLDTLIADSVYKRFVFVKSKASKITKSNVKVRSSSTCKNYAMRFNLDTIGKIGSGGFATVPRVEVQVDMAKSHKEQMMSGILSSLSQKTKTADWTFDNGCAGKRCSHDLVLTATYSNDMSEAPLLLDGNSEFFVVNCSIKNQGPDYAYFSRVNITSKNLAVLRVLGGCASVVEDESDTDNGVTVIKYHAGKLSASFKDLMLARETCQFTIEFGFGKLEKSANVTQFKIDGLIYSNGGKENLAFDNDTSNNHFSFKKNIQYKTAVTVDPVPKPKTVSFHSPNDTNITTVRTLEDDILGGGKTKFTHEYTINNHGPLGLADAKVKISWPEKTKNGYNLLYLVDVTCKPEKACKCDKKGKTNKLEIAIDEKSVQSNSTEVTVQYPNETNALKSTTKIECSDSRCDEILCDLGYIEAFDEVVISAHFLPWVPTFGKNFVALKIYSSFELMVANSTPSTVATSETVGTTMASLDVFKPRSVPEKSGLNIGAIIGAIVGGIVLLVVAVLIMWKAGFFKSKYGDMTREAREANEGEEDDPGASSSAVNKSTEQLNE